MILNCCILLVAGVDPTITSGNISSLEMEALRTIYDAMGGTNWSWDELKVEDKNRPKWFEGEYQNEPCGLHHTWRLIECDKFEFENTSYVKRLNLIYQNLNGTIPTAVFNFPNMSPQVKSP